MFALAIKTQGQMDVIITNESQIEQIFERVFIKCFLAKQQAETIALPAKTGNYTSKELMELFIIKSKTTIWNWEKKGLLNPVIVQRGKVYLKEDIEKLIQKKKLKKRG